ncbi:hypothetical protein ABZZ80_07620 [Streptomyces sp. NPDC006356]
MEHAAGGVGEDGPGGDVPPELLSAGELGMSIEEFEESDEPFLVLWV